VKKKTILSLVLLVVLVAVGHSAFAASQESYDVSVPAFGNAWSREYLLLNGRLFETRLLASGGKNVFGVIVTVRAQGIWFWNHQ
jgi:hypothetical protein